MKRLLIQMLVVCVSVPMLRAQVLIDDFIVNDPAANTRGLGRPAIAAHSSGGFAVAWQDFNDYNIPIAEQPRIAVQLFSADATPIGPTNLFQGESRLPLSIWTSDFLEPNPDIVFHPDGTLLVAVEHEGRLSIGSDDIGSAEVGLAVVLPTGQVLDASGSNTSGVILWLISTKTQFQQRPRIAMAPSGDFFMTMDGLSFDTNFNAVLIQQFDTEGNFVGDFFNPHTSDPGPNSNHQFSDFATNGITHVVIWQDDRQDGNWDITAQFYNNSGEMGGNLRVNNGDAAGTINIWPSIAMNQSGNGVAVWADTRTGADGEIFGQLFNANGQAVAGNFQISAGHGEIMDRPEVAMLIDGDFMVVWTDSMPGISGTSAFRARGRQFSANATPVSEVFILPNQDIASGVSNIATDGTSYYLTWRDDRRNETYLNMFAKKMAPFVTSVATSDPGLPPRFELFNAYPNPFNPSTTIQFAVPSQSKVTIKLFDLLGREVTTLIDEEYSPGEYELFFEAEGLTSGIYFYRIIATTSAGQTKAFVQTKKLTLLK